MQLRFLFAAFINLVLASALEFNLKPARRHNALTKRNSELFLASNVELIYSEDVEAHAGRGVLVSRFELQASRPTLLLEDFDHLLRDVRCTGSTMTMTILSSHVYEMARTTCESLKSGLLISSHFSCSENDKHSFYQVLDVTFDDAYSRIKLELQSRTFEELFDSVAIHMGQSTEQAVVHQHDRLFRREAESSSTQGIATSTGAPEAQGTHTSTFPLNFTNTNSSFADSLDLPIEFGCKNCSSTGELVLTTVDLELNNPFNTTDDDPVKTGSIQFDLKGFELSIGLRAVPSEEFQQVIPIFTTPRFGINGGLVSAGIDFGVGIDFQVEASGGVELGFGFDVIVPDSTLRLDIAELENSFIRGLNGTKITPKLLEANASDVEVSLVAGLQPSITFGITLGIIKLDAGPYMDLPKLNMTINQLATDHTGANCETNNDTDVKFRDAFKNLTHVDYNVGLAAGLKADVGPFFHPQIDLVSLAIPVATQCLVWQSQGTTTQLAPATAVLAAITAPPSSTSSNPKAKSAASSLRNFLSGMNARSFLTVICILSSTTVLV